MNVGHIAGGTNAGWKKPFRRAAAAWRCACKLERPGAWANCPDCGERRPT